MKKIISLMLACAAYSAHAADISLNNQTYTISTFTGSYNNNVNYFNINYMPWWGSRSDANAAALSLGNQLGYLNSPFGPYFASVFVSGNTRLDNFYVSSFVPGSSFDGYYLLSASLVYAYVAPIGPSLEDTQASMTPNAYALRGAYSLQSAIINTGLTYDCTTFDKNGICVSAGGRVTDTNNPSANSQGALLIASYRANEQWRVGAYLDQNLSSNDARGVNLDNNNPMGGVFAVWNQNTDGTGYQVRLASGYSDKDVTISRSAYGATGEAGKGDSSLQSQAYSATLSRGFQLNNTRWIASPYLGVRYTKIKRAGYTEDSSADVTTPLTYSALSQETTTALVGVRFNGQLGDKINLMASAGIENDIAHNTGDYVATGVDGLTPVAFNQNIRHIRPVASAGASYAIDKRQTVGANVNFRQEAFNSTNSVSGMLTYQVGF